MRLIQGIQGWGMSFFSSRYERKGPGRDELLVAAGGLVEGRDRMEPWERVIYVLLIEKLTRLFYVYSYHLG